MDTNSALSNLMSSETAERTSAIRALRFENKGLDLMSVIAQADESPFVRLEAMAYLSQSSSEWLESLEQIVLTTYDETLRSYGDYLLREIGSWD